MGFHHGLLALIVTALALLIGWVTLASVNNLSIRKRADAALRTVFVSGASGSAGAGNFDSTVTLEELRKLATRVSDFHEHGAPLSYRLGFFGGDQLDSAVTGTWCQAASRIVVQPVLRDLERELANLPPTARLGADYYRDFSKLKAYLMLTSASDQTDVAFLERYLFARFPESKVARPISPEILRQQLRFLAAQVKDGKCIQPANEPLVERARLYLKSFQPPDRIYDTVMADLSANGAPLRFEDKSHVLIAEDHVPGVYTAVAFPDMRGAIRRATFNPEPWVLGVSEGMPRARQRYE